MLWSSSRLGNPVWYILVYKWCQCRVVVEVGDPTQLYNPLRLQAMLTGLMHLMFKVLTHISAPAPTIVFLKTDSVP